MYLGNMPKAGEVRVIGKRYWRFAVGRNAMSNRFFESGWYGFEFVVLEPLPEFTKQGDAIPYSFRIAFAFWLPIYPL